MFALHGLIKVIMNIIRIYHLFKNIHIKNIAYVTSILINLQLRLFVFISNVLIPVVYNKYILDGGKVGHFLYKITS